MWFLTPTIFSLLFSPHKHIPYLQTAKNVILTGVKSVTLYDDHPVQWSDLSSQFYLTEQDVVNKSNNNNNNNNNNWTRSDASLEHLKELNQYVSVTVHHGDLNDSLLSTFNVIVFADDHLSIAQLVERNEFCRSRGIKFIAAESRGLFGSIFCDFGTDFVIYDEDGENPVTNIVTNITNSQPGSVSVHDDKAVHGLYDDDYVVFEGLEGALGEELNHKAPIQIKSTGKHTFTIGDTTHLPPYTGGGYVKQVKPPKTVQYDSLAQQLQKPTIIDYDFAKFGRPLQLHAFSLALSDFTLQHGGQLPRSYNEEDATAVVELAKQHYAQLLTATETDASSALPLDDKMIKLLAYGSRGNLSPMAALLGGIAA